MKTTLSILLFCLMVYSSCMNSSKVQQKESWKQMGLSGYITIDGTQLNYVTQGNGKPCFVIGSSIYYSKTFSKSLLNHFKFYFVDMRWFAKNYLPVNLKEFSLQTILDDIEKVRSELKIEKIIIIGHSIHGAIAYEYAKKYPQRVSHLIMIGAPSIQSCPEQEKAIDEMWKTASAERKSIQDKNWKILAGMKNLSPSQFEIENYCLMSPKYWYNPTYDARWLWKDMTLNTDILHYLYENIFLNYNMFMNGLSVPVLTFVALGRYDFVDPYTLWNGYNNIPELTIRIFEKSGHTPQLEESQLFDNELLKWINAK
jgi:proline iminopeptidase